MYKEKFFKVSIGTILVLIILLLLEQLSGLKTTIVTLLSVVIIPVLFSSFLYYLLRPIVRLFDSKIKNRTISIFITFILLFIFILIVIMSGGSIVVEQSKKISSIFLNDYEKTVQQLSLQIMEKSSKIPAINIIDIEKTLISLSKEILYKLENFDYIKLLSSLSNIGTIIILIPFMLFFFLKDDAKIYQNILAIVHPKKRKSFEKMSSEIDKSLGDYIISQLIVALFLGFFMLIGYLIIGMPNALILSLIGIVASLIPIIGTIIGLLPAVFIALTLGIPMIIKTAVVLIVAQILEGNLARPLIQGNKLEIHPVIVALVVVISIFTFGALGALFAVPAYIIIRIFLKYKKEFIGEIN